MKVFLKILAFLIIGEIIFQIHVRLGVNEIKDIQKTTEGNTNPISGGKIYLLGDSYTKGLGVKKENRIANRINVPSYIVIDSSQAGDNWSDYIRIIKSLDQQLHPNDFIVIGVNWNDVNFKKGLITKIIHPDSNAKNNIISKAEKKEKAHGLQAFVHSLYNSSKLIDFVSSNLQNTLRRKGIPLPIGDFQYFRAVAYHEKKTDLDSAMVFLNRTNITHNTHTILYLMPDFNLTKRLEYFKNYTNYFTERDSKYIQVMNGPELFYSAPDGYYCLSIHDGHPNDSADIKMAGQIQEKISKLIK